MTNEAFICLTSMHLLCFTDFLPDAGMQVVVGWSLVGTVVMHLLTNIYFLFLALLKTLYLSIRKLKN